MVSMNWTWIHKARSIKLGFSLNGSSQVQALLPLQKEAQHPFTGSQNTDQRIDGSAHSTCKARIGIPIHLLTLSLFVLLTRLFLREIRDTNGLVVVF